MLTMPLRQKEEANDEMKESDHVINDISKKLLVDQLQYIKIDES